MRALITGGTGFVGAHLTRYLRGRGDEVLTLGTDDRSDYGADVRDRAAVCAAVDAARPDVVLHLAAIAFVPLADAEPELTDAVNRVGTENVLEAAARAGARTLMVSSGSVYGRRELSELPVTEADELRPVGEYARSKAAAEELCIARAGRQPIVRVRAFNQTGPGQHEAYVCSDFARQVARSEAGRQEPRIEVGDLSAERDFLDVRDAVVGYVAALERGRPGGVYNVCSGRPVAIREIVDILVRQARVPVDVRVQRERLRAGEVSRLYGTAAKLERETGWRPTRKLEDTLADVLEDWRARLAADREA